MKTSISAVMAAVAAFSRRGGLGWKTWKGNVLRPNQGAVGDREMGVIRRKVVPTMK
jgi:hypothetical protein